MNPEGEPNEPDQQDGDDEDETCPVVANVLRIRTEDLPCDD